MNQSSLSTNQRCFLIALGLVIGGNLLAGILSIPLVSFVVSIAIVVLVTGVVITLLAAVIVPKRFQQRAQSIAESLGCIASAYRRGRDPQP